MTPRPDPVTSDWQVARAMADDEAELCWTSAEIADILGITVFQITARLKGMEGRRLTERAEGYWRLTGVGYVLGTGPEPPHKPKVPVGERVYHTPTGGLYSPGGGVAALPDDSLIPRRSVGEKGWKLRYIHGPKEKIPVHEKGKLVGHWYLARLQVEVFIDPDGVEWVKCDPVEVAELIVPAPCEGLTDTRLRRLNGSTAAERRLRRHEDDREEVLERDEARKARKRQAS